MKKTIFSACLMVGMALNSTSLFAEEPTSLEAKSGHHEHTQPLSAEAQKAPLAHSDETAVSSHEKAEPMVKKEAPASEEKTNAKKH